MSVSGVYRKRGCRSRVECPITLVSGLLWLLQPSSSSVCRSSSLALSFSLLRSPEAGHLSADYLGAVGEFDFVLLGVAGVFVVGWLVNRFPVHR